MARLVAYLYREFVGVELCPRCHHMSIAVCEITIMTASGVGEPRIHRIDCEECSQEEE